MSRRSHRDERLDAQGGFTLLEVLMALAILGGGMFILLESHFATMSLFSDSQDAALMELLSQQGTALAEVEILAGEQSGSGEFGDAYPDYSYSYNAELLDEEETPGLLEVTFILVSPNEEREFRFRVYDGILVDPEGTQNAE